MATTTPNLGLTKPATTENYSIPIHNTNADLIDVAIQPSMMLVEVYINDLQDGDVLAYDLANTRWYNKHT
jgi:hypothetical protein